MGDVVLRQFAHRADRARPRLRQQRRQPSPPPGNPRQQAGAAQQPSDGDPGAGRIDHPERARAERDLSDGAEHARRDLSRCEQAAGRLADPPAEPDRRLADADRAERDLPDGDDADGDLTDRDDADGGRTPAGRRVDAAHHVHQRQPTDPQARSVLEARRSPPRPLSAPVLHAQPSIKRTARLRPLQRAALRIVSARAGARLWNGHRRGRRRAPPGDGHHRGRGRGCRWLRGLTAVRSRRRGRRAGRRSPRAGAQQHLARRLCRLGALRQLPRRDHRGLARLADAPHDAAAGGGAHPGALRRDDVSLQGRQRASHREGRRAVRRADLGERRPSPLSRHARHRRSLSRGLRGRRGRCRRDRQRARADPSDLVRLRDAELSPQGLLGAGDGAAGAARGRRLESDLRLLPQHRPLLRRCLGRAL